jgi:hypothetical protein
MADHASLEDSPESTGSSQRGAPTRGGAYPPQTTKEAMEEEAMIVEAERYRHDKLYRKVMLLHCVLASPKMRESMAEPMSYRPELHPHFSMETQIQLLALILT